MPFVSPGLGSLLGLTEAWTGPGRTTWNAWVLAMSQVQSRSLSHLLALVWAGLFPLCRQKLQVCSSCSSTSAADRPILCSCSWIVLCCSTSCSDGDRRASIRIRQMLYTLISFSYYSMNSVGGSAHYGW